ncbi:GNAT family N-acetyltransferase [Lacrimispora saccharolytica]|uniref:GCN5-related N-acetyltransferase n=1 Tax=Lacrimispora saccharolytica (strain ATCC 35040 / DSM 2544 / NRCC 2533 / WM1) TaxID=610130 RepID=D9R5S0_LACSW|nr:N-acetyltransferase [Lacrimispora saccharolytica]ADL05253.1 GCN5-related N-acetyltransferase [[Clostridium] saccharolyticum WM1]QRV20572.1 N-acetyltransferase [Lacrimispora saccharolytica]
MNNKESYIIRNEQTKDLWKVEDLTRKAFWNLNVPGCSEHYMVHVMRNHPDFIPELDFVLEKDNRIIGNIMYTKAKLVDEEKREKQILTFGPLSVHPDFQRKGYGKALLEYSFDKAKEMSYDVIVIFGNPENYVSRGFKSCKKFNICTDQDFYPAAMLVKELTEGCLDQRKWRYIESEAYQIDETALEQFDLNFEKKEKKCQPSQEEFYILSHSKII